MVRDVLRAGADAVIVEWEDIGGRPGGGDFDAKRDALRRVREATPGWVIARLSDDPGRVEFELESALELGANEIWLPKIRSLELVRGVHSRIAGRGEMGLVLETAESVHFGAALREWPLRHVHVGLTDLCESLGRRHPFEAIADGALERLLETVPSRCGFGGLTLPDLGQPVPCRLLMGEMARLKCGFSLLRQSFLADCRGGDLAASIAAIRAGIAASRHRTPDQVSRERDELCTRIQEVIASVGRA